MLLWTDTPLMTQHVALVEPYLDPEFRPSNTQLRQQDAAEQRAHLRFVAAILTAIHEDGLTLRSRHDLWVFALDWYRGRLAAIDGERRPLTGKEMQKCAVAVKSIWDGIERVRESDHHGLHLVKNGAMRAASPLEAA